MPSPASQPPKPSAPGLQELLKLLRPDRSAQAEADAQVRLRSSRRLAFVGVGVGVGFLALILQAGSLMLRPNAQLAQRAKVQFEDAVEVSGARGDLIDRKGRILATSVELASLHVDPYELDEASREALAQALAPHVSRSAEEVEERFAIPGRRDVLLARGMTPDQVDRMRQDIREAAQLNTDLRYRVWTEDEEHRFYPGESDAAPLLGLVGRNGRGMAGLERSLDRTLRGETYKYVLWRDRKGRRVSPEPPEAAPGKSVRLTLDHAIQRAAEDAIDLAMEETGAEAAFAVVVDVESGDVLAMANRPTQNPNDTRSLSLDAFKNRAAMDAFEPGSVFKPFVAAAALEEGLVTPDTIVDCEGGAWVVGRKRITDDHPKGAIPLFEVIKFSSNIGAAKLAFLLGPDRTLSYLDAFGFGRSSGLDLPGETRGVMRKPGNIKPIELATTSYGHGVSANAIQLAYAMAAIGNGGVRMQPRLISEILDAEGQVVQRFPVEEDRQVISERTARESLDMMVLVTEKGGTGTRARVPGFKVAGKTGTAWKHVDGGYSATDRIGSFVGIAPADKPRIAIAISVDTPTKGSSYGGIVAGPAFSRIAGESLRLMGVEPDPVLLAADLKGQVVDTTSDQEQPPMAPPRLGWDAGGDLVVPDLSGLSLRDSLLTLEGAGIGVRFQGSGRVAAQIPAPGNPVAPGQSVELVLR